MKPQNEHTPLPWEEVNFINHDGTPIKTKDEIVALISESVMKGDGLYLAGVSIPGDSLVVCYTGNGPKAKANAALIVRATNHYELMVDLLRRIYQEKGGAHGNHKEEIEKAFNSMGEVL